MSTKKYMINLALICFLFTIILVLYSYFNNYLRPINFLIPLFIIIISVIIPEINKKIANKSIRNITIPNGQLAEEFKELIDSIFGKKKR